MNIKYLYLLPFALFASACEERGTDTNRDNQPATGAMGDDLISPSEATAEGSAFSAGRVETIGSAEGSKIGSTEPGATTPNRAESSPQQ